jgi:hypothetical protein
MSCREEAPVTDTLFDRLNMPTSPDRPFEDDGVVMAASDTPLLPMQVWSACQDLVASHLSQVCAWPAEGRGRSWRPGDYSFYILEFEPQDEVKLFVQFWSEPGEKVLMEVCSPASNPGTEHYLTDRVREALAERGFEPGGEAGSFGKTIDAPDPSATAGLAREALAVLTECLGYDGRQPLGYLFCLGRRDGAAKDATDTASVVVRSLTLADLESLLTAAGHSVQPLGDPRRGFLAAVQGVAYSAALTSPQDGRPGHFGGLQLSAFAPVPESLSLALVARLALDLPCARLGIDADGDLALMQTVVLEGGVTRQNLALQFGFWQQNLERVKQTLMRHAGKVPGVVLH